MIPLELIYHNHLIKIELNQAHQYLQATWLQHPNREEFKTENRLIADYILASNVKKVLFDVRKRFYLDIADQITDQSWLEQQILPLFQDYQQFRCAYLITPDSYQTMYTNQVHGLILDRTELFAHMEVGIFLEVKEAQDWLLNG